MPTMITHMLKKPTLKMFHQQPCQEEHAVTTMSNEETRVSLSSSLIGSPLLLQYGFNMVMSHPHAVNEIALSLNNRNPR